MIHEFYKLESNAIGYYYQSKTNPNLFLRKDGSLHDGTGFNKDENNAYFNTKEEASEAMEKYLSQSTKQVGGSHYIMPIEPIDYIVKNNLGYREGNVVKYVSRHKKKNGAEDIKKAIHYLEMILEDYEKENK